MMKCHYCGMTDFDDDKFCEACGEDWEEASAAMGYHLFEDDEDDEGAGPAENSDYETEDTEGAYSGDEMEGDRGRA